MTARIRLGMLTPSSNTVLEPITGAMLAGLDGVSAHLSRFPVTEIALSPGALAQFDDAPILAAAGLRVRDALSRRGAGADRRQLCFHTT